MYQKYEYGLQPLIDYSLFTQNSALIVHHDIFESKRAMEFLREPHLGMYNNVSKKTAIRPCKDPTKHMNNHIL